MAQSPTASPGVARTSRYIPEVEATDPARDVRLSSEPNQDCHEGTNGLVPHGGNSVTLQELEMPVQQGFAFCIPRSGTRTVRRKFAHP